MTRDQVRLVCPNCESGNLAVFEKTVVGYTGCFTRSAVSGVVEWRYGGDMFYVDEDGELQEYRCRDCGVELVVDGAPVGEIAVVS